MSTNKFVITFTLRQHTPIIHFQWHEKDATIRPTELKAKLDKWIIHHKEELKNDARRFGSAKERLEAALSNPELKKWIKGATDNDKTHPALNYSVRIQPVGENLFESELNTRLDKKIRKGKVEMDSRGNPIMEVVDKDYAPYFGNQLKEQEWNEGTKRIKRLAFHKGVILTISSPYKDLIKEIANQFPEFLLKTNFGTRQGKGFGSFFLDTSDPLFHKSEKNKWFKNKFDWKFDVNLSENQEVKNAPRNRKEQVLIEQLFVHIDMFYKTLRSGINTAKFGGVYYKSLMFQYVKERLKKQWDKKTIKQKYFLNDTMSTPENEANQKRMHTSDLDSPLNWEDAIEKDKFLWRDLLGLSSEQQWIGYNPSRIVKQHLPLGNADVITRFKSPIYFKPIRTGQYTFRVFFEVPKNIKDAFSDTAKRHLAEEAYILGKTINIDTSKKDTSTWGLPFPNTFNFDDFLQFALSRNPSRQVFDTSQHTSKEFKTLQKMKATKL